MMRGRRFAMRELSCVFILEAFLIISFLFSPQNESAAASSKSFPPLPNKHPTDILTLSATNSMAQTGPSQ